MTTRPAIQRQPRKSARCARRKVSSPSASLRAQQLWKRAPSHALHHRTSRPRAVAYAHARRRANARHAGHRAAFTGCRTRSSAALSLPARAIYALSCRTSLLQSNPPWFSNVFARAGMPPKEGMFAASREDVETPALRAGLRRRGAAEGSLCRCSVPSAGQHSSPEWRFHCVAAPAPRRQHRIESAACSLTSATAGQASAEQSARPAAADGREVLDWAAKTRELALAAHPALPHSKLPRFF
jgi:hypothetical protein